MFNKDSYSKNDLNFSVLRFQPVLSAALEDDVRVRGYVSCVVGCPYEGSIRPKAVTQVQNKYSKRASPESKLQVKCYRFFE